MNLTCIICSDGLVPSSDIYTTPCGHLFHYPCLLQWIERSQTCPQCRNKANQKTIHRIYFNLANTDNGGEDPVALQNKLDNLQFQMALKQKDVNNLVGKHKKMKAQNVALREEVAELEGQKRVHESVVHALRDQISFFKSKSKERDKIAEELSNAKMKLKNMESIQIAVNGSREEVNEMLRNQNDIDSLVILTATLKKALIDAEQKKRNIEHKFKSLQNEITRYRRDITSLESTNKELRKEVELTKTNWGKEKKYLTNVVKNIHRDEGVPNVERIVFESPVPLPQKHLDSSDDVITITDSPSLEEKVAQILDSDSPYLRVRKEITGITTTPKISGLPKPSLGSKQISIFKRPTVNSAVTRASSRHDEMIYTGLGGQSREDLFPSPRNSTAGLKRHRTETILSSAKSRKVAPLKK